MIITGLLSFQDAITGATAATGDTSEAPAQGTGLLSRMTSSFNGISSSGNTSPGSPTAPQKDPVLLVAGLQIREKAS